MPAPKKTSKIPIVLVVLGSILSLGLIWGLVGTIVGMSRAFNSMGSEGMGAPEGLATDIGLATGSTAIGFLITPVGVILLAIGIPWMIKQKKTPEA